jgi:hypothetical protein
VEFPRFLLREKLELQILLFFTLIVGFACCITRKNQHRKNLFYDSLFLSKMQNSNIFGNVFYDAWNCRTVLTPLPKTVPCPTSSNI